MRNQLNINQHKLILIDEKQNSCRISLIERTNIVIR